MARRFFSILAPIFLVLALPAAPPPVSPQDFDAAYAGLLKSRGTTNDILRFRQFLDLEWRHRMAQSPEAATYNGVPGFNDRWSDFSPEAIDLRKAGIRRSAQVLDSISRASLSPAEQLNCDLYRREISVGIESLRFPGEYLLISQMDGVQRELPDTLSISPAHTVTDLQDQIARLEKIPRLLRETENWLREGIARKVTAPRFQLRDVPRQIDALVTEDPSKSALFRSFAEMKSGIPESERAGLKAAATKALVDQAFPALKKFSGFIRDTYLPGCRETIACSALPNGEEWYRFNTRTRTTTTLTPAEIHEIGQREVRRIRSEMDRIMNETGFKGTFPEFLQHLRTSSQFYYSRTSELLAGYRDIAKRVDAELPKLFGKLPRTPYGVQPIPTYSEQAQTAAYYQPGSLRAGRPGNFYANTYALDQRPKYEMEALTLHEAVPGHHLQIALAQELEDVPEFRKHSELTAFVEGWALYSESLGPDLGMYTDPYSKFGQLTYEIWRAIRLVVDTGIHSMGWSRQQAIDFFKANAGKSEHDIAVEVDRYIVWPGQALAYKIGELKIKELRKEAEQQLGRRFDLRAFHDELLGQGALPLDILETRMRSWMAHAAQPNP